MAPAYSMVTEAGQPAPTGVAGFDGCPARGADAPRADGSRAGAAALVALCLLGGAGYAAQQGRSARTELPAEGPAASSNVPRLRATDISGLWEATAHAAARRHLEDLSCGPYDVETDWDFTNTHVLHTMDDITTAEDCQNECKNNNECGVWSWGKMVGVKGLSTTCFLKRLHLDTKAQKFRRFGVVSGIMAGIPCEEAVPDADRKRKILGVLKVREGLCLAADDPTTPGTEVQMWSCIVKSSNQIWVYNEDLGQIKNEAGLCLAADHWSRDFVGVHIHKCDAGNWSQQWTFDSVSGMMKIWRGNCMESGEPGIDGGSVYMQACNINVSSQQWDMGDPNEIINENTVSSMRHYVPGSLYCFALMMPGSYEQDLLEDQQSKGVGMFDCDDWTIYSNKAIKIGPKLASVIDSDLKCDKGGEFGTALNLDIFIVLWGKVTDDGFYLQHDWSIKADPDAVFFPLRLRSLLTVHTEVDEGSYINNCKYGLHGPVEVFSRNAVTAWATGWKDCKKYFDDMCGGDCFWGEDLFIDQCLWKVLGARRENDFRLMLEDHCDAPPGWEKCTDEVAAVFHPFKNVSSWNECLNAGRRNAGALNNADLVPLKTGSGGDEEDGDSEGPDDHGPNSSDEGESTKAEDSGEDESDGDADSAGEKKCPEGCHTAEPGEACYKAVLWARTVGYVDHPEWYPTLSADSTWEEFQSVLEQGTSAEVNCKPPCGPCGDEYERESQIDTVFSDDDAGDDTGSFGSTAYEDGHGDIEPLTAKE